MSRHQKRYLERNAQSTPIETIFSAVIYTLALISAIYLAANAVVAVITGAL